MLPMDPDLTPADKIVLRSLHEDIHPPGPYSDSPKLSPPARPTVSQALPALTALANPEDEQFQPIVFTTWDRVSTTPLIDAYLIRPYVRWASTVVRTPSDVVYITHILILFALGLPNFVLLWVRFNWIQAVLQWMLVSFFMGPYSIIVHHHTHYRALLSPAWAWLDTTYPYVLGPMMGQTWNSFYYHHKHHHIEENGPADLSSTLRYQRDSGIDLSIYVARFVFLIWFELPRYYISKGRLTFAFKYFAWETASYAFIVVMARYNFPAAMTTLLLPLIQWRILIMINNWAQHAFVDEEEPTSNLRASITLIDVVVSFGGKIGARRRSSDTNLITRRIDMV